MDEVGASALSHIDALYKNLARERKSFYTLICIEIIVKGKNVPCLAAYYSLLPFSHTYNFSHIFTFYIYFNIW